MISNKSVRLVITKLAILTYSVIDCKELLNNYTHINSHMPCDECNAKLSNYPNYPGLANNMRMVICKIEPTNTLKSREHLNN